MSKNWLQCTITLIALLSISVASAFVEGKDYSVIAGDKATPRGRIEIIEFFSYSCHWCAKLEPALQNWLTTKPRYIDFRRVHVAFSRADLELAKSYYVAKALNIEHEISDDLFNSASKSTTRRKSLIDLFKKHGVTSEKIDDAFNYSPSIDQQVKRGIDLVKSYQIYATPSIMINGRYLVDSGMADGDNKKFFAIVNYLVNQIANEEKLT